MARKSHQNQSATELMQAFDKNHARLDRQLERQKNVQVQVIKHQPP